MQNYKIVYFYKSVKVDPPDEGEGISYRHSLLSHMPIIEPSSSDHLQKV